MHTIIDKINNKLKKEVYYQVIKNLVNKEEICTVNAKEAQ